MQLHFSVLGLLGLVLYAGCIFHAIKAARINYWLLILIFLPGLGSIAYLLLVVLPELRTSRAARCAVSGIGEALDPNRALRESAASGRRPRRSTAPRWSARWPTILRC